MILRFLYYLRKAVIFSVIALLIIAILAFTVPIINNNIALSKFSKQLTANLPPDTVIVETKDTCGHLSGNNSGMEFLAVALVQSDLSIAELTAYYHALNFAVARPDDLDSADSDGVVTVLVQQASAADFILPYELYADEYTKLPFKKYTSAENLYYIAIYDGKYLFSLDIRSS